jgi:hypothetical protein
MILQIKLNASIIFGPATRKRGKKARIVAKCCRKRSCEGKKSGNAEGGGPKMGEKVVGG